LRLLSFASMIFFLASIPYCFIVGFSDGTEVYRPSFGAIVAAFRLAALGFVFGRSLRDRFRRRLALLLAAALAVLGSTGLMLHTSLTTIASILVISFFAGVIFVLGGLALGMFAKSYR